MAKTPRPKKPTPEPVDDRRRGFQVHLSQAEVDVIDAARKRLGMMRATFMRQAALEKAGSQS